MTYKLSARRYAEATECLSYLWDDSTGTTLTYCGMQGKMLSEGSAFVAEAVAS